MTSLHDRLQRLVGAWTTESTHPAMPGQVVRGSAEFEWLAGERFLVHRSRADHPAFPVSLAIIGQTGADRVPDGGGGVHVDDDAPLTLHYFDSRGVFRVYDATVDEHTWRYRRTAPGFSQRFTATFEDGGDTLRGLVEMSADGVSWEDDLRITYRRAR